MSLRALFFDFDGLILDTETPEVEVWSEVFAEHGQVYPDEYWMGCIGRGADQIAERPIQLLARICPESKDWAAIDEDRRRRLHRMIDAQPVRAGVIELITEARSQDLKVAVVSSSHHAWVDPYLERLGIRNLFDRSICRDDAEHAKPFPHLYLKACEIFHVEPSEAIAFEDSPNGLRAAKAAGIFAVAVPNATTARLDLSHADARFETLSEVTLGCLSTL